MPDISFMNEMYEIYYRKAKECYDRKDLMLAKRYYFLAAEQMLKMAQNSEKQLQKARFSRAKSLIDMAESIQAGKRKIAKDEPQEEEVSVSQNEKISLEEALSRLARLEGLEKVKRQVCDWIDQIKVFQMRKERGMSVPDISYHMVFTGNPGTGKTTLARLMAQIYCALGILSNGNLVEVDRSGLVAGYIGQTAVKTKEAIKKAYGGVLFIDEAYSLANGNTNDFGQEAIEAILKEMEDKRDDLVVIVAGYDEPMEKFIASNPGLKSRFKNFFHFDDYNGEQLFNIFQKFCEENEYSIDYSAAEVLKEYFQYLYDHRDKNFGNARDVRNFFENVVTIQSKRVVNLPQPSNEDLQLIKIEDLPSYVEELLRNQENDYDSYDFDDGEPEENDIPEIETLDGIENSEERSELGENDDKEEIDENNKETNKQTEDISTKNKK